MEHCRKENQHQFQVNLFLFQQLMAFVAHYHYCFEPDSASFFRSCSLFHNFMAYFLFNYYFRISFNKLIRVLSGQVNPNGLFSPD